MVRLWFLGIALFVIWPSAIVSQPVRSRDQASIVLRGLIYPQAHLSVVVEPPSHRTSIVRILQTTNIRSGVSITLENTSLLEEVSIIWNGAPVSFIDNTANPPPRSSERMDPVREHLLEVTTADVTAPGTTMVIALSTN